MTDSTENEIEVAKYVDHTCLSADASEASIEKLCAEAVKFGFKTVCINPIYVLSANKYLKETEVYPITVVGFPLGASCSETKVFETKLAIEHGAKEIDMVINIGQLKNGNYGMVENDIKAVVIAADTIPVKVIIETALLTQEEKVLACKLSKAAGADFVKTSTGFSKAGATVEDIKLMRATVGPDMGVKASGGVRSRADALAMIEAGATRIGASAGPVLLNSEVIQENGNY